MKSVWRYKYIRKKLSFLRYMDLHFDYIIVGSGFGGSVAALRLSEKGYSVLVLEKGKRWKSSDFPRTNWNLRKWMWLPSLGFHGFFKLTFMRHVGILSGVGVGGGSLVYAGTLPRPEKAFFSSGSWAGLADWEKELEPYYREAEIMLGVSLNPKLFDADSALGSVASQLGKSGTFTPTRVGTFFGEPEKEVPDPFFGGEGPARAGCSQCGGCMTGCRYNAKNSLDKNYLYLAGKRGVEVLDAKKVIRIEPSGERDGSDGYRVIVRDSFGLIRKRTVFSCKGLVIAGGVLGTVRLLLDMKRKGLERLSDQVGQQVRTNNESLVLVHSRQKDKDFSRGVAIGSIFPPDEDSHIEAVRYSSGSGFWKLAGLPQTYGGSMAARILKLIARFFRDPRSWLGIYFSRDFAKESMILLFMQHLDSTLCFRRGLRNMRSGMSRGNPPSAFIPLARELSERTAGVIKGTPFVMATEALAGIPTTAHILGGCVIGKDPGSGVIDPDQAVYGYRNMYVCDGSAVSANPGVNPSLTITAMTERAMQKIPSKNK
jgi:cholesterol oxidase